MQVCRQRAGARDCPRDPPQMVFYKQGALKMQHIKLLHNLIVLLRYVSDRIYNSLLSTYCFDELFLHLFPIRVYK